jgi:hypothetical protein
MEHFLAAVLSVVPSAIGEGSGHGQSLVELDHGWRLR